MTASIQTLHVYHTTISIIIPNNYPVSIYGEYLSIIATPNKLGIVIPARALSFLKTVWNMIVTIDINLTRIKRETFGYTDIILETYCGNRVNK